jgi:hypothetical protein
MISQIISKSPGERTRREGHDQARIVLRHATQRRCGRARSHCSRSSHGLSGQPDQCRLRPAAVGVANRFGHAGLSAIGLPDHRILESGTVERESRRSVGQRQGRFRAKCAGALWRRATAVAYRLLLEGFRLEFASGLAHGTVEPERLDGTVDHAVAVVYEARHACAWFDRHARRLGRRRSRGSCSRPWGPRFESWGNSKPTVSAAITPISTA